MKYGNYRAIDKLRGGIIIWPQQAKNTGQLSQGGIMNEKQNIENRLWDYIDGLSLPTEKSAIDQLIISNLEWKQKYEELVDVHHLMENTELEAPSLRFSKNVMEEIAKCQIAPATKTFINKKIIWGIGGFFIAMILGLLVYGVGQIKWSGTGSSSLLSKYSTYKIDWSKIFTNTYANIFMMVNVVLGLMLLDMYLQRKKVQAKEKES